MQIFSKLRVSTRLLVGFGTAVAVSVLIASVAAVQLRSLSTNLAEVANDRMVKFGQFGQLSDNLRDIARSVRNVLLVPVPDYQKDELAKIAEWRAENTRLLAELDKTVALPRAKELLKVINETRPVYNKMLDRVMALDNEGQRDVALAMLRGEVMDKQKLLFQAVDDSAQLQFDIAKRLASEAERSASFTALLMLALAAGAAAVSSWLAWLIARGLSRSLGAEPAEVSEAVERVARGDLCQVLRVRPEHGGSVMASLQRMQQSLADIVASVRGNAESVATASAQIAQGNLDLSQRTEQQAGALQETAAAMEELTSTVRQNADNAQQGKALASAASSVAAQGGEVVGRVVETMTGINDSSKKIVDIIGVIDGIAFQTNILALNAAVEAARAGEQGRGFAVVAAEVRSLAQRSSQAAKEIKGLIAESVDRVDEGVKLVHHAGETMREVVGSIGRVTDIMGEISTASTEQSAGVSQVGEAVAHMDKTTQQNAALVEESAAAASSLRGQAEQLVGVVAVFKTTSSSGLGATALA